MDKFSDDISAVVLAGGKSSRMGQDKALMSFSEAKTMTQYQYEKLGIFFQKVYISSKEDKFNFQFPKELLILDKSEVYSPLIALKSILETIDEKRVFITTVDAPLVLKDTIKELVACSNSLQLDIVVAKDSEGVSHNLCGVFSKSVLPVIEQMLQDDVHKISELINRCNSKEVGFNLSDQFLNINTQKHYTKALSLIK